MTPQVAVAITSFIGTLIFFSAGYFFSRSRMDAYFEQSPQKAELAAKIIQLESQYDAARSHMEKTEQAFNQQQDTLMEQQENDPNKKEFLQKLMVENEAQARKLASLKALQPELEILKNEKKMLNDLFDQINLENETLKDKHKGMEELKTSLNQQKDQNMDLLGHLEEARRIQDASNQKIEQMGQLYNEKQDLALKVELLEERLKAYEELQEENQALKVRVKEFSQLEAKIESLESENLELRSMAIAMEEAPKPIINPTSKKTVSYDGLGEVFENIVTRLSAGETSRGTVMADELGLLIAGTGQHMESLAVMAALFSEMYSKMKSIFPIGSVDCFEIINTQKITIRIFPILIASNNLLIVSMSVGAGPDRTAINNLLSEI
jgi:hypothetical protein